MNQRWPSILAKVVQGNLFTHYFLSEGVRQTPEYQQSDDDSLSAMLQELRERYLTLRSAQAPDEADTEDDLIKPILEKLGFHYSRQKTPQQSARDRPDFLLFADAESKRKAKQDRERQYQYGVAILEAKRFERPLDRRGGDPLDPGTPSNQILRYLSIVEPASNGKILWGILTNGRLWRLYYHKAKSRTEGYIEFDLAPLFNSEGLFELAQEERLEAFKLFYLFFRRDAFVLTSERPSQTFLECALEEGKNYEERVTEDLKQKIFEEVFIFLARGFVEDAQRKSISISQDFLDDVYKNVLTLLYRLLFILYAEDRDLLPVRDDRYDNYSLRQLRDEIERRIDAKDSFSQRATSYWDHLKTLFRIVNDGDPSINVPIYNGGLFDPQAHPFLEQYAIADDWLAQAIDRLSRDYSDPQRPRRINYRDLGVRQLGSIYEGLLEFKLHIAQEDLVVVKKNGNEVYLLKAQASGKRALAEIQKGELFITNDKSERKATGSYYTPDYIVQYIVKNTLSPLVQRIEDEFEKKVEELKMLKGRSARRKTVELAEHDPAMKVLELKVLDPAMGSGHFLVSAVDFLADCIIELLEKHNGKKYFGDERYESPLYRQIEEIRKQIRESAAEQGVQLDETKLEDKHIIKRMVMKRCIYGVDLNEMAVELAKVSLWLHSFTVGAPLSFLDHHLKCGNSLIGVLDVSDVIIESSPRYREFVRALHNMILVGELTDVTLADTRESARLFAEAQGWLEPFRRRLDVSLAMEHFMKLTKDQRVTLQTAISQEEQVQPQIQSLLDQALEIARQKRFFHWKLEFPEVWYTERGLRANPGFDAVVGNPPYGSAFTKVDKGYLKRNFSTFQLDFDSYVFFWEIAITLARKCGSISFITPEVWLRLNTNQKLREMVLKKCHIRELLISGEVFKDAVVFTCVPVMIVLDTEDTNNLRCRVILSDNIAGVGGERCFTVDQNRWLANDLLQIDYLLSPEAANLINRIKAVAIPLRAVCNIAQGITAYDKYRGQPEEVIKKRAYHSLTKKDETFRPWLAGTDVSRYEVTWSGEWISYGPWLAAPRDPKLFLEPRIIFREVTGSNKRLQAQFTQEELYYGHSVTPCLLRVGRSFALMYLLALSNSALLSYYTSVCSPNFAKSVFPKLNPSDIEQLPIRRIFFTTPKEERARLVEQLKELYNSYLTERGG